MTWLCAACIADGVLNPAATLVAGHALCQACALTAWDQLVAATTAAAISKAPRTRPNPPPNPHPDPDPAPPPPSGPAKPAPPG